MSFASFDPSRATGALAPPEIGVCTGEGARLLSVNDAFERISGCSRDAILQAGAVDVARLLPTEWQEDGDTAALFAHGHGYSRPYLRGLRRPDGTQIDIIVIGAIAATAPLRWICCVVDASAMASDLGAAARNSLGLPPRERRGPESVPRLVPELPTPAPAAPALVRPILAAVLDAAPSGALLLNAAAEAVHVTPAACTVLGHVVAHFTGSRWRDLVHPDDLRLLDARLLILLGGVKPDAVPPLQLRWHHARGVWHLLEVHTALVPDGGDCVAVLHLHDRAPLALAVGMAHEADAVRRAVLAQTPGQAVVQFDGDLHLVRAEGEGLGALCAAAGVAEPAQLKRAWVMRLATVRDGYDDAWTVERPNAAALHCTGTALRDSRGVLTGVLLVARSEATPREA